jgi:hypothetical protein
MIAQFALTAFIGVYSGEGIWHDSASQSKPYRIQMKIEMRSNATVRLWFQHLFYEENNSVIEQAIEFTPQENGFFSMVLVGTEIHGSGYCSKDICHYTIPIPNNQIEVTYFFLPNEVRIVGSAEKNSHGNKIWWKETVMLKKIE